MSQSAKFALGAFAFFIASAAHIYLDNTIWAASFVVCANVYVAASAILKALDR